MRRKLLVAAAVLSAAVLYAAVATTASATPGKTTACTACHGGPTLATTATQTTADGPVGKVALAAPGADYIAVFRGSTKVASYKATGGTFAAVAGLTYTAYAVNGPGTRNGAGSVTFAIPSTQTVQPADVRAVTLKVSDSTIKRYAKASLRGTISPAVVGYKASLYVKKPGSSTWVKVASPTTTAANTTGGAVWRYSYTVKSRGTYRFQARYSGMVSTTVKVYVN